MIINVDAIVSALKQKRGKEVVKRPRPSKKINKYYDNQILSNRLIDELGGNNRVAELLGISQCAVSYWRKEGIPELRLIQLSVMASEKLAGE